MSNPITIASEWYIKLNEADCSEEDRIAFETWKEASPAHLKAWNRILQVNEPFEGLEPVIKAQAKNDTLQIFVKRPEILNFTMMSFQYFL